jgi:Major Facilitator Superfamily
LPSATTPRTSQERNATLTNAAIIVIAGGLATTIALPQMLARIPLQNLLKNALHVDRVANAAFFFWITLPWYFKPFVGVITDAFPLFESRRKNYLLISSLLAVLSWIGLIFTPHEYSKLLWTCLAINIFTMVASTVVGAYMVEAAQAAAGSGRLTAVRQFVTQAGYVLIGPTAGYMATLALGWTATACGGLMFLLVPATIFFLHEQRMKIPSRELLDNARTQLVKIGAATTMWAAAGLMALFYIAPGLSTAIFYKQQNELHLNTQAQGYLQFLAGVFGLVAAVGYGYFCRRWNLRNLLAVCLLFATAANLGYLFYSSLWNARIVEGFNGFGFSLAELALMDLAIRATPRGSEGLGFSLMMSVRNIALFGTDWFGSKLLEQYHLPFNGLVLANAATTLITVPLVFLLPALLLRKKDAEPRIEAEEVPPLKTALQE